MAFKKIEAIVRVEKLDEIRIALEEKGIVGMTVTEVKGRGAQKGILLEWRAGEYRVEFLSKIKIELVVDEKDLSNAINAIETVSKTGRAGDGKIFIYPCEELSGSGQVKEANRHYKVTKL